MVVVVVMMMMIPAIVVIVIAVRAAMMVVVMPPTVMVMTIIADICAGSPRMSAMGQKAKNSLRANVFRCPLPSNNGHSWAGPSKALGEVRGLLLSLVGERFEP